MEDMTLSFSKCHALGADYIIIDNREKKLDHILNNTAYLHDLCHRNFGIGAGGVVELTLCDNPESKYEVNSYGAHGRLVDVGGTSNCCLGAVARNLGLFQNNQFTFWAVDKLYTIRYDEVRNIYIANFGGLGLDKITKTGDDYLIHIGCNHYVKFVDDLSTVDVVKEGREICNKYEDGINVDFVEVDKNDGFLKAGTFCRSTDSFLEACGSGSMSIAAIAEYRKLENNLYSNGKPWNSLQDQMKQEDGNDENCMDEAYKNEVRVKHPGGDLLVSYEFTPNAGFANIQLAIPVTHVYDGQAYI